MIEENEGNQDNLTEETTEVVKEEEEEDDDLVDKIKF